MPEVNYMKATVSEWLRRHRKQISVGVVGFFCALLIVQSFYPTDRLLLSSSIDGREVGGWQMKDAAWELNHAMKAQQIAIYVGSSKEAYAKVKPEQIGLSIDNEQRVKQHGYPWYMRIIPTSLFWYGSVQADGEPTYRSDESQAKTYLEKELGKSCNIPPKDATLKFANGTLEVVSATDGGICRKREALAALATAKPRLNQVASVTIPVTVTKPNINDQAAKAFADTLTERSKDGVVLKVASKKQTIAQNEVLSWLDFNAKGDQLTFSISKTRSKEYFAKNVTPKVSKPAGVTKITTQDFTVLSKKVGAAGQTLNTTATIDGIEAVLSGKATTAIVKTVAVAPKVVYTRTYTKTSMGISALIQQYDTDHKGVFGVAFQELSGQGRSATHNGDRIFVTASTYKLFVAYGVLKRVDAGTWHWTDKDISAGRNLSTCFDDMIVKSDNECAKAMLLKIGLSTLTKEIQALGLTNSSFMHKNIESTPNDLRSYLIMLENGSLPISSASRSRLIDAMERNVYRQGIPTGASGQVADKVGFLWALLHDAAIIYSPKGTYVLVIMTDGSSWANIADLTQKIEALR